MSSKSYAITKSIALYEQASRFIPGGVNSPVRAFKGVGGNPVFFKRAQGPYLFDEDDNRYIDYVGAWGPMIIGHGHPAVIEALQAQLTRGIAFGAPTALEVTLAERICKLIPSIDSVRLVNSGTEATMSALRLARGFTGRDKVVKFEGCYHGHVDSFLVKAGSGALTNGNPDSAGIPKATAELTYVLPYNDLAAVEALFASHGKEIACLIVEPVAGNMNLIPPREGYLQGLRDITRQYGTVLIFDEVMTGFRVALGGAQARYGITPDLTAFGKIIGGGLPVGAFGGRKEIMDMLAPFGPVYQAGTLSGNPLAVTAGLVILEQISAPGFHDRLEAQAQKLLTGLKQRADAAGIPFTYTNAGGMFGIYFNPHEKIEHFSQVMDSNVDQFRRFFHGMLENGVYLAPSAFEAGFISAVHGDTEIAHTLDAAEVCFAALKA